MRMPKTRQSENEVKKVIKEYLEYNGWKVYRINNGGTYRGKGNDGKNKFSFAGDPGVPDLFCRKRGVLGYQMWIECKATGRKPSKEQQEFINDINSIPKGIAFWCDSFERFLELYSDIKNGYGLPK